MINKFESPKHPSTQEQIECLIRKIERTRVEIDRLAKEKIPEFHFLNHKVSNFWKCDKSPIGWCVWDISENGYHIDCQCYYCKGPVERK